MSAAVQTHAAKPQGDTSSPTLKARTKPVSDIQLDYTQRDWRDTDTADIYDFWEAKREVTLLEALNRLHRAVNRATERPLPKQEQLEAHFDQSLSTFSAVWSHEIRNILKQLKVKAAVIGDCMILPEEGVSFETLMHETTHLLQTVQKATGTENSDAQPEQSGDIQAAEAEADSAESNHTSETEAARPKGSILFRAATAQQDNEQTDWEASQDYRNQRQLEETNSSEEGNLESTANDNQANSDTTSATGTTESETSAPAAQSTSGDVLQLEPAPSIESEVPDLGEAVEAAEAEIAASIEALDGALTPEDFAAAFHTASPSVKADRYGGYQARMDELAASETETFNATLPEPEANLSGNEESLPPIEAVTSPVTTAENLEAQAPAATPDPEIAPTAERVPYTANANAANALPSTSDALAAAEVAAIIASFTTSDNDVDTSAGPPPSVPLEGESNPERMSEQSTAAADQAGTSRDAAMASVIDGPGPEQVQLREMNEAVPLTLEETALATAPIEVIGGADEFTEYALDAESQALFDQAHGDNMQANLDAAQSEATAMAEERDTRRDESVSQATTELAAAEDTSNTQQRAHVQSSREAIQAERQSTLEAQGQAVTDLDAEIATENSRVRGEIDTRVQEDEAQVVRDFEAAEEETNARVAEGEAEAEEEREAADREAENASWWDRAVNWVASQLKKLTKAIGAIFDAVRAGVTFILDKVKDVAFALIDAAASFVKGAITVYGEFLKAGVNLLIGTAFPEFAAQLTDAIDAGVSRAHDAVDVVADNLKAAVNAIVDALNAAINAVLSFVEGALNTIIAVVAAVLTGDWSEVARLILEPLLRALGVEPAEFYTYIGNAMATIGNIIDDPLGFIGNLFSAVVEGFRKFGNNFFDHLISGIIGWLTGAFAGGITMPEKFDFWGILDIARQILGLTVAMMRRVAVRILGQSAVAKIEFFIGYAVELITGGWSGFFDKIKDDLSGLADTVMGEITKFLTERLIKAGIVWLASLINPAGALLKIVMMIWDFIMWMKDNFSRIVKVVQTVVDGMIQIANGNIEPAAKAIEKVLAGLMPPTIDLIARLIGLGNVAGRVKDIIGGIRKKIEDAIVKLIRKVLARFTGRGGGRATGGEIMTPLSISGGGEQHTLYVREQGNDVVPMMRSTPIAIENWLNALKGKPGVEAALRAGSMDNNLITDEVVTQTKNDIAVHVTAALQKEDVLDAEGEQADDALDSGAANAASETADVNAAATQLKTPMERILTALGLSGGTAFKDLDKFKSHIAETDTNVKTGLNGSINSRINADPARNVIYSQLEWSGVAETLGTDPSVLTNAFKRPLHSGGIFASDGIIKQALFDKAVSLSTSESNLTEIALTDSDAKTEFLRRGLLPEIQDTASVQILVKHALLKSTGTAIANDLTAQLKKAVETYNSLSAAAEDYDYKDQVKAAAFRPGGLFSRQSTFTGMALKYYVEQPDSGAPTGDYDMHPLIWFLTKSGGSPRAQKNISYTADMVRAADPGQHEWILSSTANQAIQATINSLQSTGGTDEAAGFANFVEFQHQVRTPTTHLMFSPGYVTSISKNRDVQLLTHQQIENNETLTATEIRDIRTTLVPSIQAHAGGLNMVQLNEDGTLDTAVASQSSSPRWHSDLQTKTSNALSQVGSLELSDMTALGDAIKEFFRETIFNPIDGVGTLAQGGGFGEYRFSGGGGATHNFGEIKQIAWARYDSAWRDLGAKIQQVVNN